MARHVVVSFEDGAIKIVYASVSHKRLTIQKTLVLNDEELDNFLLQEHTSHFTVVCDFKEFYQDILLIPPVKKSFVQVIIRSEIKKRAPEFSDSPFFYTVIGGQTHEGKKAKEIFVFAVKADRISQISDRFSKHGKRIRYLYPSVFTLSQLVSLFAGLTDGPVLCVSETETSKTLLLIKDKNPRFVRVTQSLESGIHDLDAQNINMTINHCRQTLKTSPTQILLIGSACSAYETTIDMQAPVSHMRYPANIGATEDEVAEFVIPISAILHIKDPNSGNLLPKSYRLFEIQKTALIYCTFLFLFFSAALLGYIKITAAEIASVKEEISFIRDEMGQIELIRQDYNASAKELQEFVPLINFMNTIFLAPSAQKALITLSALKKPHLGDIELNAIRVAEAEGVLSLHIEGNVIAVRFLNMQRIYQGLLRSIKMTEGMELVSERIDIEDKTFQIEVIYTKNEELKMSKVH